MSKGHAHKKTAQPHTPEACRTPESVARQLDDELEQSFPASDPPSMVRDTPTPICGEEAKPQHPRGRHEKKHGHG
ncbi:hypothetical protein [Xanthobacter variabilis]|uniref:hypothetical protein n=1 Tax=Xanthobacter variabilis TaxID=3119932 RepID=UPI003728C2D4